MDITVDGMALSQIGPFTGVLEALAAAVGAGALFGGYIGGGVGAVLILIDLILRYALTR